MCVQDEDALQRAYVETTERLLQGVRIACPAARVVILGSAAEYGNSNLSGRISEGAAARPDSAYGRSKLEQSELARQLAIQWDLDVVRVRLFNTLGPRQGPHLVAGAMVLRMDEAVLDGARSLEIYDPESQRDYLDVRDVARLLWRVAQSIEADPRRPPIHICSGEGVSVACLAQTLVDVAGQSDRVFLSWVRHGDPTCVVGEPSTLAALLGPDEIRQITLATSLQDMWEWQGRKSPQGSGR
jgi:nucleoside-diphosphate-sugar epimerase